MKESYASMTSVEEMMEEDALQHLHFSETLTQEKQVAYEMREGKLSLFKNDKEGNEKRPDFTGKGLFDGKEVHISLWQTVSKNGTKYLSGDIQPPYNGGGIPRREATVSADDVPF